MRRTWFLLALALPIAACVSVENFAHVGPVSYTAKDPGAQLDVYYLVPGAQTISQAEGLVRAYDIIASFEVKQFGDHMGNLQKKAQEKAREVGGDAIVYQPLPSGNEGSKALVWVLHYTG
jgi:hypothetical protein